jgi:hypothetical protein
LQFYSWLYLPYMVPTSAYPLAFLVAFASWAIPPQVAFVGYLLARSTMARAILRLLRSVAFIYAALDECYPPCARKFLSVDGKGQDQ